MKANECSYDNIHFHLYALQDSSQARFSFEAVLCFSGTGTRPDRSNITQPTTKAHICLTFKQILTFYPSITARLSPSFSHCELLDFICSDRHIPPRRAHTGELENVLLGCSRMKHTKWEGRKQGVVQRSV